MLHHMFDCPNGQWRDRIELKNGTSNEMAKKLQITIFERPTGPTEDDLADEYLPKRQEASAVLDRETARKIAKAILAWADSEGF